jgi:hypothetical protein
MVAIQYGLPQLMSILGTAHYNAFYLAYTLNLVIVGFVNAIGLAALAPIARLGAEADRKVLVQVLSYLPPVIGIILIAVLFVLRVGMPYISDHWSRGLAATADINVYLFLLGLQTIARSLSLVFSIVLASRTSGLRLIGPSLIELALTVLVAIPLGRMSGTSVFLLALVAAGLLSAMATAAVALKVGGLHRSDQLKVLTRFALTEITCLLVWWSLGH